ncbi:hypothetical protein N7456_000517 [Penicillium angulare]|uniref:Uncharacterized protein n=1 Tax=Penicillium angulare TaxID=116970 RepID=A0A9W9GCB1_9EURO|nr:hypothetical protein N7456_000517 [Penicillium angulare]
MDWTTINMANLFLRICGWLLWLLAIYFEGKFYLRVTKGIAPFLIPLGFSLFVRLMPDWPFYQAISAWLFLGRALFDIAVALKAPLRIEFPRIDVEAWRDWLATVSKRPSALIPVPPVVPPPPAYAANVPPQWVELFPVLLEMQRRIVAGEPVGFELGATTTPVNPPLERDPPMTSLELRGRGIMIARFIEDANAENCPVRTDELTWATLNSSASVVQRYLISTRAASRFPFWDENTPHPAWIGWHVRFQREGSFSGYIAPGIMVLSDINRFAVNLQVPHTGSVFNALYLREYGTLDSLRQIFATVIVNQQTRAYLNTLENSPSRIYERATAEYLGILGTRIGRTVGYLVIAAFPRGTHRIARIQLIFDGSYHLRFFIETSP